MVSGLKLGTETVKKLGKKKTVKLCVRGMLTKSSELLPRYLHLLLSLQAGALSWLTKEMEFDVFPAGGTKLGCSSRCARALFTGRVFAQRLIRFKKEEKKSA